MENRKARCELGMKDKNADPLLFISEQNRKCLRSREMQSKSPDLQGSLFKKWQLLLLAALSDQRACRDP
jgi:hypothetical protein